MCLKYTFFSGEMWGQLENAPTALSAWTLFFTQILQALSYTIRD